MAITFRFDEHLFSQDKQVIEVWQDGQFKASIYPSDHGLKIISKWRLVARNQDDHTCFVDLTK